MNSEQPTTKQTSKHRWLYGGALVFLGYAVLAVLVTWPLAAHLGDQLPNNSDDTMVHFWNGWSVQQALRAGRSPYFTPLIFYPRGVSLVTHNLAWFQILPWLGLGPLLGGIAAYNVALLFNLTLCGCAAFLLTRHLSGDGRAALVAGAIYLAWPYRTSQLDHPNLIATQWIPIFVWCLSRTLQEGKKRYALLAGLSFALVGYTRWQLLIPATLVGLVYTLFTLPAVIQTVLRRGDRPPHQRQTGRQIGALTGRLALAGLVAGLALLPPGLLLLDQLSREDATTDLLREGEETVMQTDLLAFVTPAPDHPWLGAVTRPLYDRYYPDRAPHRRSPAYLGMVALVLAALGAAARPRRSLPWLVAAVLLGALALGPLLRLNGQFHPAVPMPYGAIRLVRLMRVPDRFNMFLALPVAVMAAYGVAALQARWRRGRSDLVVPVLGGLVLLEYLAIPAAVGPFPRSPWHTQLAQEPGTFAALNLPIDPLRAKAYMFQQVQHGRPILQGKIARLPSDVYAYLDSHPWLRSLRAHQEMDPALTGVSRQLASLAQDGVRYVLVHKTLVGADRVAHWRRYMIAQPRYEDERLVVYATQPEAGRDFNLRQELVPGLGPVKQLVSADCLQPGQMLEVDVGWGSTRALDRDFDVALALVDGSGQVQQSHTFPLAGQPTHQWPAHALAWGYYPLRLSPSLAEGAYAIRLALLEAGTEKDRGAPFAVQPLRVQTHRCPIPAIPDAPPGTQVANARFGDDLHLLAYRVTRNGPTLSLTLYWRAQRRMPLNYKIFVHVFDPATGIPVAQDDAEPHRGGYPTLFWAPEEIVQDHVPVSLTGVSPGRYGIAIGAYNPATGDRLPVIDAQGRQSSDGRLVLEETVEIAPP
jgi:hypothetical protein